MSRKVILTLAAATLAASSLASSATFARGSFGGGGMGGGHTMARSTGGAVGHSSSPRLSRTSRGRTANTGTSGRHPRPGHPVVVGHLHPHHPHMHWVFRDGGWIEVDDVVAVTPVDVAPASVPGPCTCLTKTYTPAGLVVFADVCTKESASAPATDDHADASQAPTATVAANATPIAQVPTTPNYAGRTYQDYLAANPQASESQASSQSGDQSDSQQN